MNHFHNPLQPWSSAGLHILGVTPFGESAVLWAQDSSAQANWSNGSGVELPYPGIVNIPDNTTPTDWSWQATRDYFYLATTATSTTDREANFAKTFFGLGHQMHLLQDMSVPMHVRNNQHLFMRMIEGWVVRNESTIISGITQTQIPMPTVSLGATINGRAPVARLFDTDTYTGAEPISMTSTTVGLAEWTNANFFSDDTLNLPGFTQNSEFPYPNADSTDIQTYIAQEKLPETYPAEDGIPDTSFWIKKTSPEGDTEIEHFAKPGYFTAPANTTIYNLTFNLDDKCYEDYAEKLIPRAVGYSAGLLNYFFRGTLDVIMPDRIVYGIADGSAATQQFTTIKAKVQNTTPNEAMGAGILQAVARYKIRADYQPDLSTDPPTSSSGVPFSYSVSAPITITSLPAVTEFTFDFTQGPPIPAGITDLDLFVVFKGTLGNETDTAVAVGMEDLYEPLHITVWNSTDRFYLDNILRTREDILNDPELLSRVDHNSDGSPDERINRYYVTTELAFASGPVWAEPYQVSYYSMPPGRYGRLLLLADTEFWIHARRETSDVVAHSLYMVYDGVVNAEYDGTFYSEQVYDFRGILQHGWLSYAEYYPDNTDIWLAPWPVAADPTPYPVGYIRQ